MLEFVEKMKITLIYFKNIIDQEKIEEADHLLKDNNIELVTFDKTGHAQASFDQLISQIYIGLSSAIVSAIASGLLTNAMYDAIKTSLLMFNDNLQNKKIIKISCKGSEKELSANFGVKFNAGYNEFDLQFSSGLSESLQTKCIEEAFKIIKREGAKKEMNIEFVKNHKYMVGYFNENIQEWELVNFLDLIKEKREHGEL